ncbi:hypothetical protein PECL_1604 [Pediococcus claussenii ATCC BAA-344]|uniref:Uncharacterized protein n=1 Tax=Pediococcus claussenii (strain ATCC BAA-344 / DSM 14800 / JCM 18046 / KCTC 3811 / LMG 21948 / P06) TaxID=701521 RepID=G8PAV4_PEDCP|nr:hypothetical protein PECL_1604 [Pediococcus claussenii ATCC BAA-344]ANZ69320.1 hypothetical protein AYR57_02935 [Pediococcus claussenii]ANZ71140.1 hypothetical protein AYR58_02950 [Pediococcus claussenii]
MDLATELVKREGNNIDADALNQLNDIDYARKVTIYVNLEPCGYFGKQAMYRKIKVIFIETFLGITLIFY